MNEQKTVTLNNGVKMPVAGIGTFLLSPDEAEASVLSALQHSALAYPGGQCGHPRLQKSRPYPCEF